MPKVMGRLPAMQTTTHQASGDRQLMQNLGSLLHMLKWTAIREGNGLVRKDQVAFGQWISLALGHELSDRRKLAARRGSLG